MRLDSLVHGARQARGFGEVCNHAHALYGLLGLEGCVCDVSGISPVSDREGSSGGAARGCEAELSAGCESMWQSYSRCMMASCGIDLKMCWGRWRQ